MDVKLASAKNKNVHVCPIAQIRIIGSCGNYECPANLVRLTAGKKTGCFHEQHRVGVNDFSKLWGLPAKEAQAKYSNSISTLEKMTTLYRLLQEMREECKWKFSCHSCGSPLKTNFSSCLNAEKCTHRAKLIQKQKNRVPFSLPGLNIRKIDIWMFIRHYGKQELRQLLGVYFPETLWDILPPLILEELGGNVM
jgi:hypothetical protein